MFENIAGFLVLYHVNIRQHSMPENQYLSLKINFNNKIFLLLYVQYAYLTRQDERCPGQR